MSLRDYFEQRAREGSWSSLYDRAPDIGNYNFLTRRRTTGGLLERDGEFPRVLDVGCGTGDYARIAAAHGGVYFGLDFAPGMVAEGRRRVASEGHAGHFLVGSGEQLPFADGTFDLVLALGYIAYFADPGPALAELRRVLRPGGALVMQCAKPDLVGRLDSAILVPLGSLIRSGRLPRPAVLPEGWVNVRHSEKALDALAREAGFERTARAFDNYNLLPGFLRRRYPQRWIQLSEALTHHHPSWWSFLAVNYIGKYTRA